MKNGVVKIKNNKIRKIKKKKRQNVMRLQKMVSLGK